MKQASARTCIWLLSREVDQSRSRSSGRARVARRSAPHWLSEHASQRHLSARNSATIVPKTSAAIHWPRSLLEQRQAAKWLAIIRLLTAGPRYAAECVEGVPQVESALLRIEPAEPKRRAMGARNLLVILGGCVSGRGTKTATPPPSSERTTWR